MADGDPRAMNDGDARAMVDGDARAMNDGDARAALVTAADYEPPTKGEGERETLLNEAADGKETEYDLSKFYDCDAALDSWRESWPSEKQEFCCASEGKGCVGEETANATAAPGGGGEGGAAGDGWDPSWDEEGDDGSAGPDYAKLDIPKSAWGTAWESLLIGGVPRPKGCWMICASDTRCVSWLWMDEQGGNCRVRNDAGLAKGSGGRPHSSGGDGAGQKEYSGVVSHTSTTTTTTSTTSTVTRTTTVSTTTTALNGTSMYCWMVARPGTFEVYLLGFQHKVHTSVFECDSYSVFSSEQISVAPGFKSTVLDVDQECDVGGDFKTPLNIDVFLAAWQKVFKESTYLKFDWTVKVDADAVFLPQRLRYVLLQHTDSHPRGVYFVNCKYGLRGPIEVFSRRAVRQLSVDWEACRDQLEEMCKGPCPWGEDMFIDQCLKRVLKIERTMELTLLMEDHCNSGEGWEDCWDDSHVAFHPFREVNSYETCLNHTSHARS